MKKKKRSCLAVFLIIGIILAALIIIPPVIGMLDDNGDLPQFTEGGICYTLYGEDSTMGGYYEVSCGEDKSALVDIVIPSTFRGLPVTGFDGWGFRDCLNLKTVVIEDGITRIDNYTFSGCTGLTSITIPDSVTEIGELAFSGCRSLASIQLPSGITEIGERTFAYCALTSIEIPSGVTSIEDGAFSWCEQMSSVTIPDSVTSIGAGAFSGCNQIETATIPAYACLYITGRVYDEEEEVYDSSYDALKKVVITSGTALPDNAFYGCHSLSDVTLPSNMTSIGAHAFRGCAIEQLSLPAGITSIGEGAFANCHHLKKLDLPAGITSIENSVFSQCEAIENMVIPAGVTSIGDHAFDQCTNLKDVTIPNGITNIGEATFYYCENLTNLTLPDSLTKIGADVFNGCRKLESINYAGSISQWESIIASTTKSYTLNCSDGIHHIVAGDGGGYTISHIHTPLDTLRVDPTCTETGIEAGQKCQYCGVTVSGMAIIPATGNHIYGADRLCSGCARKQPTDGLSYQLNDDGRSYILTGIGTSTETALIIPESYEGLPVTGIAAGAFKNHVELTDIEIPSSIVSIGNNAFEGCDGLRQIDGQLVYVDKWFVGYLRESALYSASLRKDTVGIANAAFQGANFSEINIPQTVVSIGDYAFYISSLTKITVPGNVRFIGEYAFGDNSQLEYVNLKNGVESIGEYAFYDCPELTNISLPNSINYIGSNAFTECDKLKTTERSGALYLGNEDNPYVCLIKVTNRDITSFSIPTTTKVIYGGSNFGEGNIPDNMTGFGFCDQLEGITIPSGVTYIGYFAFIGCDSLTEIVIPENVIYIDDWAFSGCDNLERLEVSEANTVYHSSENCLIQTAIGKLVFVLKTAQLPDDGSIKIIGDYAFSAYDGHSELVLPEGVEEILGVNCDSATIIIPKTVKRIGTLAFVRSLKTIIFDGSVAQWQDIIKEENWDGNTDEYTVDCTDGTVSKDGTVTPN